MCGAYLDPRQQHFPVIDEPVATPGELGRTVSVRGAAGGRRILPTLLQETPAGYAGREAAVAETGA